LKALEVSVREYSVRRSSLEYVQALYMIYRRSSGGKDIRDIYLYVKSTQIQF